MAEQSPSKVQRIQNSLSQLLKIEDEDCFITLSEFVELYHLLTRQLGTMIKVHIVLLGKDAAVQFTSTSDQRLVVRHNKRLTKVDFDRTVGDAIFFGDIQEYSPLIQIRGESKNWLLLSLIFLGVLAAMVWTGLGVGENYEKYLVDPSTFATVSRVIDGLKSVNDLVITCATLFLSIFVVFTVAQNTGMAQDIFLFSNGLVHKFFRDDIFITKTVIISLLASLVNVVLLASPAALQIAKFDIAGRVYVLNKLSLFCPLITAFSATGLGLCFISILYYQKRTMSNLGTIMAESLLKDAYSNRSKDSSVDNGSIVKSNSKPN